MTRKRKILFLGALVLGVQLTGALTLSRKEYLPSPRPLAEFPWEIGEWRRVEDQILEPGVLEMLAPDDFLNRVYMSPQQPVAVSFFMVYYKTQYGASDTHDPKVCLPGAGWDALDSKVIDVSLPDNGVTIPVNHYLVAKGSSHALVLYWYETHKRSFARQQWTRIQRILDTVAENRTDIALVRLVVPIVDNNTAAAAEAGIRFIRDSYPYIRRQFPPKEN